MSGLSKIIHPGANRQYLGHPGGYFITLVVVLSGRKLPHHNPPKTQAKLDKGRTKIDPAHLLPSLTKKTPTRQNYSTFLSQSDS